MDEILNAFGLKFEEITLDERHDLERMAMVYESQQQLTFEDIRKAIQAAISTVSAELVIEKEGTVRNIFLKARLMNYMMLDGLLSGPQQARDELSKYAERLKASSKR